MQEYCAWKNTLLKKKIFLDTFFCYANFTNIKNRYDNLKIFAINVRCVQNIGFHGKFRDIWSQNAGKDFGVSFHLGENASWTLSLATACVFDICLWASWSDLTMHTILATNISFVSNNKMQFLAAMQLMLQIAKFNS